MNRRRFLSASLPLIALPRRARAAERRNVLFIVADDMNTALGCYGDKIVRTPNIDALGRRGVVFDHAYCQYPLCQPSRTSFLSGRRPETTKVYTLVTPTRQYLGDTVFLPEHFRKQGYYTAHVGKVYHTGGDEFEDARSWDEEFREYGKTPPPETVLRAGKEPGPKGHTFEWDILKSTDEQTPDGFVARKSVELMEKAVQQNKPFFLGVGFRRPHAPYAAPQKWFDLYPPAQIPLPYGNSADYARLLPAAINHEAPDQPLTPKVIREHIAAYYACNSFIDAQVGHVLDAVGRLNLWGNTSIVFLGDNGYHLGDHGGLWHKSTLFEQAAHIPLIAWSPDRKGLGQRSSRLVELVDLYPTLTELSGLSKPDGLEGTSFVPLLDNPKRPWKKAAFSTMGRGKDRTEAAKDIEFLGQSVRTERWRYTEWDGGKQGIELYDESEDPLELHKLSGQKEYAKVEQEMKGILRAGWRGALPPALK
jgi:iduronate 2-sulfatase